MMRRGGAVYLRDFNPDEPRDDSGRWSSGGGSSGGAAKPTAATVPASTPVSAIEAQAAKIRDTPEFKAWFGDSKVVDKNGDPILVYHGTAAGDFSEFKMPAFFTSSKDDAQTFTWGEADGRLVPVYLSIKNPMNVFTKEETFAFFDVARRAGVDVQVTDGPHGWTFTAPAISKFSPYDGSNPYDLMYVPAVRAQLAKEGYDGIFGSDVLSNYEIPVFLPLRGSQIKSAIGNRGTFDPGNSDITKDFDPNEPRDPHGEWTSGGAGAPPLDKLPDRHIAGAEAKLTAEGNSPEKMQKNLGDVVAAAQKDQAVVAEGMRWYADEKKWGHDEVSTRLGVDDSHATGMMAALSPQNTVPREHEQTLGVVRALQAGGAITVTQQMIDDRYEHQVAMAKLIQKDNAEKFIAIAGAERSRALREDLGRIETLAKGDADLIARYHPERRGAMEGNWAKALRIGRGEDPDAVLSGPKVRSFWDNMTNPTTSQAVTIDRWMLKAASGNPKLTEGEGAKMLGSAGGRKSTGRYEVIANSVRAVAKNMGILPHQAQAIIQYRKQAGAK